MNVQTVTNDTGALVFIYVGSMLTFSLLAAIAGYQGGEHATNERWQRDAIERGFATYKDGEFQWNGGGK